jgi:hypothetical protein
MMCILTVDIELGALVKQTQTLSAVLATEKIAQGTGQGTRGDLGGITREADIVAASNLVLIIPGSLGLIDGDVRADSPELLLLCAKVVNLLTLLSTSTARANVW